jgi:hypothetical protein
MFRLRFLFPALLGMMFLANQTMAEMAARDNRGDDEEQQTRTKPAPDRDKPARTAPAEQRDRKLKPRVEPRERKTTREPRAPSTPGTPRTTRDTDRTERDRDRRPPRPTGPVSPSPDRVFTPRIEPKPVPRTKHDRYYRSYRPHDRRDYRYYHTYRYHTYFLAPIPHVYYSIGFHLTALPHGYVRIVVGGLPYYYSEGVYYRYTSGAYVVVTAPIGAVVSTLPVGFIAFSLGAITYYYINETYYIWDEDSEAYVVVEEPAGADEAIAQETKGRLYVYPKQGQSEEQQSKDRYACHRWAVQETGIDPTEDDEMLSQQDKNNYRRAITACLEGRGYTVK